MPAQSKQQQKFMGIVRAIQKGDQPASKFSKKAQDAADDMKKKDVEKYASTKHKGLPKKVEQALREKIRTMVEDYVESCGYVMSAEDPDYKLKSPGGTGKVDRKLKELAEKMGGCLCEKCWKGYKIHPKRKTKILFGKRYPNCVKKETKTNEGFGSDEFLTKTEKKKFEKERLENAEVLGYKLTGTKDLKESVNESKKEKDQIIKYLQGLGFDERTAKKAVAKSYNYISKAYRNTGTRYKGDLIANILNKKESVNEDGHTDVPSAVRKLKTSIEDALQIIGYLKKVNDAEPLPSWWTDKVTLSSNYLNTARNYILNPHESVFAVRQDKIKNGERFPKEPNFNYDPEKGKSRIKKVNEMTTSQAKDTLNHLGGKRFIVMTGAKPLTIDKKRKELLFKIGRNAKGINLVTIRLTSLDLYDMEFAQVRMGKKKVKAVEKRVYGDQLQTFFKKHTGMNTYL